MYPLGDHLYECLDRKWGIHSEIWNIINGEKKKKNMVKII